MVKQTSVQLTTDYLVIKYATQTGTIPIGIVGAINPSGLIYFIGNTPKHVKGADDFEMKLIAAIPESIRNNVKRLFADKIQGARLIKEVSKNYRGNIFASEQVTRGLLPITSNTNLFPRLMAALLDLAVKEQVASRGRETKKRSHSKSRTKKPAIKARGAASVRRAMTNAIPQTFELIAQ